jgi:hypothetical protein
MGGVEWPFPIDGGNCPGDPDGNDAYWAATKLVTNSERLVRLIWLTNLKKKYYARSSVAHLLPYVIGLFLAPS